MFQVKVKSQTEVTGSKLFKVKHVFIFLIETFLILHD